MMTQGTRAADARWRLVAGGVAAVAAAVMFYFLTGEKYDLAEAAQRAEIYLQERGTELDPAMVLILDYLDRRFTLAWVRPAVARARELKHGCTEQPGDPPGTCRALHIPEAFARLIDPSAQLTPEQIAALPNTLDTFTATALYCRENGLPTTFLQDVERRLLNDDYDPPHATLGLQWAIEQGCLDPRAAEVAAVRKRVLDSLVEVARDVPQDRAIESIALLAYAGEWVRVRREWLQTIAGAQRKEGGWGEPGKALSNDHTTTLALWVLLEATREGNAVRWSAR
jgi:hypothetical protein